MQWRRTREHAWWLIALPLLLLAVGAWLSGQKNLSWVLLVGSALALGRKIVPILQVTAQRRDHHDALVIESTRTSDHAGRLEKVRDVDPGRMGVHRAHINVPYVHRDKETLLRNLLDAGKPVLVVGHSLAGKTHMSAEVLRKHFGERRLLAPTPPYGLAELMANGAQPRNSILWLDDLDGFLVDGGMRPEWVDRMIGAGNLVMATIRATAYAQHQTTGLVRAVHAELIERFEVLRLSADNLAEKTRLADQVSDPLLKKGIIKYGLAEYVGAGYLAVQHFENAAAFPPAGHPLGMAMVRVAVDWRWIGLDVVPSNVLNALAPDYLSENFRFGHSESLDEAKIWAMKPLGGTVSLLETADSHGGVRVFDYILDYLTTDESCEPSTLECIPDSTWRQAIKNVSIEQCMTLAHSAFRNNRLSDAKELWQRVASDSSDPMVAAQAKYQIGALMQEQNNTAGALGVYSEITGVHPYLDLAMTSNIAAILSQEGHLKESEQLLRGLVGGPHEVVNDAASMNLAVNLSEQGRLQESIDIYQGLIAAHSPDIFLIAVLGLGKVLVKRGDLEAAAIAFREVSQSKNTEEATEGAVALGIVLREQGKSDDALKEFHRSIELGQSAITAQAWLNIGMMLKHQGQRSEAIDALRQAAALNHPVMSPAAGQLLDELTVAHHANFYI